MSALYATLRPAWRPSSLVLLALALFFVTFLLQVVPDVSEAMPVVRALWRGSATPAMVAALWAVLVVGPAGLGLVLALNRIGLQHTTLSWHLPGVRNRLLVGTVVCGMVVAAVAAALVARNAVTTGAISAAFSLALASFLAPGFVFDVAVPRVVRGLAALTLLAVVARPGAISPLADDYPLLVTAAFLSLAWLQLHAIASPRVARLRPFRWSAFRGSGSRALYWQSRGDRSSEWRRSLATDRLQPWLHAATCEQFESVRRYLLWHLWSTAVAVVVARLIEAPMLIPAMAGTFLMVNGLQLRMRVTYPLSRTRRARLAYVASLIHATHYFVVLGLLLYATALVPLPHLPAVDWEQARPMLWVLAWGCSLAFAPIAQWRAIHVPDTDARGLGGARLPAFVARGLIYAAFVLVAAGQINSATRMDDGPARALIVMGILMVVTQVIFAARVFAHFSRGDLASSDDAA